MNTILPQEKLKLLNRGIIPDELIRSRVNDQTISLLERRMLEDFLELHL